MPQQLMIAFNYREIFIHVPESLVCFCTQKGTTDDHTDFAAPCENVTVNSNAHIQIP